MMSWFNPLFSRFQSRPAMLALGLLIVLFTTACGKPFNVKPKPAVIDSKATASVTLTAEGESQGVLIKATAITDEDYLYDTFEANLILAGVLPVQLKLTNNGTSAAELSRSKLEIRAQNKVYKRLDSQKAYKRLMSFYDISIYNKHGHKESRDDFNTHAFDLKKPLAAGESREGLIYFAVPNEVIKGGSLNLLARKLSAGRAKGDAAVELNLK
jgi:hypothetical protein